jgi:chromosome condensin MukBEF MukE localization factor
METKKVRTCSSAVGAMPGYWTGGYVFSICERVQRKGAKVGGAVDSRESARKAGRKAEAMANGTYVCLPIFEQVLAARGSLNGITRHNF